MLNAEMKEKMLNAGLTKSTVSRYTTWSKQINPTEFNIDDYVNFYKKITEEFKEKKDYTSILSVIIKVLELSGKDTSRYVKLRTEAFGQKELTEKPTEKELDNAITVPEIEKMRDELVKKNNRTMREDYELQFLQMITRIAPFRTEDYLEVSFSPDETPNYVDLPNKRLIYTKGKVDNSSRVIKLPDIVVDIITENKEKYNRKWLFPTLNASGNSPTRDSFRNFINKLFNAKIGTNMLRQIFVSHYEDTNMPKKERIQKASQMGHTYITSVSKYQKLTEQNKKPKPKEEKPKEEKTISNKELIEQLKLFIKTLEEKEDC